MDGAARRYSLRLPAGSHMFPAGHGMDISHGQIETDFCHQLWQNLDPAPEIAPQIAASTRWTTVAASR